MATASPSRPSPYRRLSTEIGYRVPQHPGRAAAILALAAHHTAWRRGRSRGRGLVVSGLVPPGGPECGIASGLSQAGICSRSRVLGGQSPGSLSRTLVLLEVPNLKPRGHAHGYG